MEFIKLLKQYKNQTVYIQTHNFPDADALGSALGLSEFMSHFGVKSILCYDGKIDKLSTKKIIEAFEMDIYSKNELTDMDEKSPIILVDSQKKSGNVTDLIGDEVACIDHHPTIVEIEYKYKDVRIVGSCSTLIADYFRKHDITPSSKAATALLYGLKFDTNDFTRGVTALDIDIYGYLFELVDNELLTCVSSNTLEFSDLSAYGAVFESIEVYDRIGIASIPFACPDALVAMISDFILALENVNFVVIYAKRETDWKFSVRSEVPEYDAGEIIHEALLGIGNGGGHACMAGGMIPVANVKDLGSKPDLTIKTIVLDTAKRLAEENENI